MSINQTIQNIIRTIGAILQQVVQYVFSAAIRIFSPSCTDKTGTLTKNEMTVCALWIPNGKSDSSPIEVTGVGYVPQGEVRIPDSVEPQKVHLLLAGAALCSNAKLIYPKGSSQWREIGDPTEAALLVVAVKAGLEL